MKTATIDKQRCDRSPFCPARRVCPVNAISQDGFGQPFKVDEAVCIGCKKCVMVCPMQAISMTIKEVQA